MCSLGELLHTNTLSLSLLPRTRSRSLARACAPALSRNLTLSLALSRSLALKHTVAGENGGSAPLATHQGGIKQLSMESVGPSFCVQVLSHVLLMCCYCVAIVLLMCC